MNRWSRGVLAPFVVSSAHTIGPLLTRANLYGHHRYIPCIAPFPSPSPPPPRALFFFLPPSHQQVFEYKLVLDKVKSTHGLEPVDTTAGRLFKRARPAFLSERSTTATTTTSSGSSEHLARFQARPAARAAGSGSGVAAVAAAAAAAAASGNATRKRARDGGGGRGLAFGAGLATRGPGGGVGGGRGGGTGKGLPTTLAALMALAGKDPTEFARVRGLGGARCGVGWGRGGLLVAWLFGYVFVFLYVCVLVFMLGCLLLRSQW